MVFIFIILFQIITCTKRSYKLSNKDLILSIEELNLETSIKRSKKENFAKNNYIKNNTEFFNECNIFCLLEKEEFNQLSSSIDTCLKDKTNIYCALLSHVVSGYKLLMSMNNEIKLVEAKKSDTLVYFLDKEKDNFYKIQKAIAQRFKNLQDVNKIYVEYIFSELNFYIRNSKLHFYVFVLGFIFETIELMTIKLSISDFETNFVIKDLIKLKRNNLVGIVNKIDLTNMFLMLTKCIFLELSQDNSEFNKLKENLKTVADILKHFYKDIDRFIISFDEVIIKLDELIQNTCIETL